MEYDYDFCVSGLSEEDAKKLMELIVCYVELCTGMVGGGYKVHEADDETSFGA